MRLRQDGCRRAAPGRREDKERQRLDCDNQLDLEITLQEFDHNCLGIIYLLLLDEVLLGRQLGQVLPDQPP